MFFSLPVLGKIIVIVLRNHKLQSFNFPSNSLLSSSNNLIVDVRYNHASPVLSIGRKMSQQIRSFPLRCLPTSFRLKCKQIELFTLNIIIARKR